MSALEEFVSYAAVYEEAVPVEFSPDVQRGLLYSGAGIATGLVLLFAAPGLVTALNFPWIGWVLRTLASWQIWLAVPSFIALGLYIHLFLKTGFRKGTQRQLELVKFVGAVGWSWIGVVAAIVIPGVLMLAFFAVMMVVIAIVQVVLPILGIIIILGLLGLAQ